MVPSGHEEQFARPEEFANVPGGQEVQLWEAFPGAIVPGPHM